MHETTLIYDEDLVRQSVRFYWMRTLGVVYWIALVMMVVSLNYLLAQQSAVAWVIVVLTLMVFVALVFPALLYVVHYRSSMGKFRSMGEPTARFVVEADTFSFSSSVGDTRLKWSVVKRIWKSKELWLIEYKQSGFNVLPIAYMSEAMREFIEERVRSAGGKIR